MEVRRIKTIFTFILCILLCVTLCVSEDTNAENPEKNSTPKPNKNLVSSEAPNKTNKTENGTGQKEPESKDTGIFQKIQDNKGMLLRTFYVLMAVTAIVVIYFVIRAWRTRRRKSKSRKYGLITSSGNDLEMEPLDQDVDEDEDMTVFEVNNRGKK